MADLRQIICPEPLNSIIPRIPTTNIYDGRYTMSGESGSGSSRASSNAEKSKKEKSTPKQSKVRPWYLLDGNSERT